MINMGRFFMIPEGRACSCCFVRPPIPWSQRRSLGATPSLLIASRKYMAMTLRLLLLCETSNAMVTDHLRAPYGVYFTKKSYDSTAPVRCPAGGRKNRTIFYHFLRHRTVPGEF